MIKIFNGSIVFGGAISGVNGTATNCNFTNNIAKNECGVTYKIIAVFITIMLQKNGVVMYGGAANNCIFSNNKTKI